METREELPEGGSASAASNQKSDQQVWGGDAGHWIAIRELGKLAILSNTLDRGKYLMRFCRLETELRSTTLLYRSATDKSSAVRSLHDVLSFDMIDMNYFLLYSQDTKWRPRETS